MLFDTDIFIWIQRGNKKAALLVEKQTERYLSVQTYMELLQGAKNKQQQDIIKKFIKNFDFRTIAFSENIGHRAAVYIDIYAFSSGLYAGDSIIAATAAEHQLILCTSNEKHFKVIQDIELHIFKP